ncbi:hypothetical protein [Streptomyces hainanensis]|nr:hypothetical protein [Streptomyces hainanensis]
MGDGGPTADCSYPLPSAPPRWLLTSRRHIDLLRVCSAYQDR